MKLYHGTNKGIFEKLEIRAEGSYLAEGPGVYMTDLFRVAKDYGSYVYELNVPDENISDFTNYEYIEETFKNIFKKLDISDLFYDIDMDYIIESILTGDGSILDVGRDISLYIDSYEYTSNKYAYLQEDTDESIDDIINNAFKNSIKEVIKYKAKDIDGFVYLCFKNPEVIEIIKIDEISDWKNKRISYDKI